MGVGESGPLRDRALVMGHGLVNPFQRNQHHTEIVMGVREDGVKRKRLLVDGNGLVKFPGSGEGVGRLE